MFEHKQLYCFADPVFFEDLSRWSEGPGHLADAAFEIDGRTPPPGWQRRRQGMWTLLRPPGGIAPDQGWKLHVSATIDNADRLCTAVWDHCTRHGVPFKHLATRNVLLAVNSKYAPRSAGGKLLTLYPRDEAALELTIAELGATLAGEAGPYVLSDVRIGPGPLYARFGGFVRHTCTDDDGEVVLAVRRPDGTLEPDRRGPVFAPPPWAPVPAVLQPHLAARNDAAGRQLPYRVEAALHFSNAGGVYRATRVSDGRAVVLKEARAHAGLDDNHDDAVTRLARERRALKRLGGVDGVPEYLDSFVVGDHHFLVEEFVEGQPLHVWHGCHHPWVQTAEPTADQLREYTERALDLCDRVARTVEEIHAQGMVFGDLHIGNVVVRPDGSVCLIDFELAHDVDERGWTPGLNASGFAFPGLSGPARDRHALAVLRLAVFMHLSRVMALDPAKYGEYVHVVERSFPVPPGWGRSVLADLVRPPRPAPAPAPVSWPAGPGGPGAAADGDGDGDGGSPWSAVTASLARGIRGAATPDRTDRLFPADTEQFRLDGTCFGHGAAGVLWALERTGHGRDGDHEQWLLDRLAAQPPARPGFVDGTAGIAYVLEHLGHRDAAVDLAAGLPARVRAEGLGMTLRSGRAGVALGLLHLARRTGEAEFARAAVGAGDRLAEAVRTGNPRRAARRQAPAPGRPVEAGLLKGWSGVALCLLRLHQHTGDPAWLDLAWQAVHRDLDRCVPTADGSLQVEEPGVRTLSYLETGSAGIAVVVDELLEHGDDERARLALPALLRACCRGFILRPDLFFGRAGLIAALARAAHRVDDPALPRALGTHLANLAWHAVPHGGELAFPADFRLSMDVASGSAGVLLAVHQATRGGAVLPFLAPRPPVSGERRDRAPGTGRQGLPAGVSRCPTDPWKGGSPCS